MVDSFRKAGQALKACAILGESADERARVFTLRLEFTGPTESTVVRYLVVGIDPILVFHEKDYELLTHFEHKMDVEGDARADSSSDPLLD